MKIENFAISVDKGGKLRLCLMFDVEDSRTFVSPFLAKDDDAGLSDPMDIMLKPGQCLALACKTVCNGKHGLNRHKATCTKCKEPAKIPIRQPADVVPQVNDFLMPFDFYSTDTFEGCTCTCASCSYTISSYTTPTLVQTQPNPEWKTTSLSRDVQGFHSQRQGAITSHATTTSASSSTSAHCPCCRGRRSSAATHCPCFVQNGCG